MFPDNDLEREIQQLEQRYAENAHGLVFAHLADAYRRAGEYSKAEGLLLHGLKTHPSYTSAYNVLGRVYLDNERYADAEAQFARVLQLDPQNLISLRALGDLAARRGHVEDARVWYERMLQVDPRSEEAREGLARLTSAPAESVPSEPVEAEAPSDTPAPEPISFEGLDLELEIAADEAAPIVTSGPAPEEPMTAEVDDSVLETVEKVKAEIEPVEGLIGDEEMSGFTLDSLLAEPAAGEAEPYAEERDAEPWALEDLSDAVEVDFGVRQDGVEGEDDEPWWKTTADLGDEVTAETMGEVDREPDRSQAAEPESPELPSMDDWSPGFVVGELLEGQAVEDLRPEEILEGLDAEISFGAIEEPAGGKDATGEEEVAQRGERVVTETMAELYASQGLYSDALAIYRRLAEARPDDERLGERILDLERRVEEAGSLPDAEEEELVRLMQLTEPAEEEPAEAVVIEEALPEPQADAFEFEDEVPLAGFEQLDPFAASFDALAAKTRPADSLLAEEAASAAEPTAEEPMEAEPAGAEPAQSEWADEEPIPVELLAQEAVVEEVPGSVESVEGDFDFGPLADEAAAEVVAEEVTEEIGYSAPEEGITVVDSIWELTDVGAPDAGDSADQEVGADEDSEVPVRFAEGAGMSDHREPSSMEDYLGALLTFDVGALFEKSANAAGSPTADVPPPSPESAKTEDLEQFQEWLRSLKR